MSRQQRLVSRALMQCRTAALGGHIEECDRCAHVRNAYNSCRNRHCPKCQSLARAQWLEKRKADLLPVQYFHVVFTMPDTMGALALQNQRALYDILFAAATDALRTIAADPKRLGVEIGFLAVLHTWGQNLHHHPHLHCVVPGGGLSLEGDRWVGARNGFLLPVRVLSRYFRRVFLSTVQKAYEAGELQFFGDLEYLRDRFAFLSWLNKHRSVEWVVYAKRPFGGPEQVLEYLGLYTHRVAISNQRIISVTDDKVAFRWKDYRHGSAKRVLKLHPHDFMRRFLTHVLPHRFVRIRYGGFLANRHRREKLDRCRELLHAPPPPPKPDNPAPVDWKQRYEDLTGEPIDLCPVCREGRMVVVQVVPSISKPAFPRMDSS